MKRLAVYSAATIAGLITTAGMAAPTAPSGVAAFIRDHKLTRYTVALADLDRDKKPEALIYAMATSEGGGQADLCGSGGCDLYVLAMTPTGYREITDISVARPPVRVLPTTTHGWRDLGVMVAGGGIVRGYEARLRYDGHSYPDNPTVLPAVRLQAIAGKQIIGEDAGQMTDTSSTAIKHGAAVPGVDEEGLDGSIGPYGVGAHMTVRNHTEFVAGHYFYARNPIDIGLTGGMDGDHLVLHGDDGSTFNLHFETVSPASKPPLTFYNSTSLVGTWTKGTTTLPVTLGMNLIGGPQGASRYEDVTKESANVFEARARHFIDGALSGNKTEAASGTSFPLNIGSRRGLVRTRQELFRRWDEIFTPCLLSRLKLAVPHEMFVHDGLAMVSNGTVWFDAKGATSIDTPNCKRVS